MTRPRVQISERALTLYFVTGNKNKVAEAQKVLPELIHYQLDIDELQTLDKQAIVKDKLRQARKHLNKPFFLEDVSLDIQTLNNLPGPFIKYFIQEIGANKLSELTQESPATATCMIGYFDGKKEHIITGQTQGKIVTPKGNGWGFNPILEVNNTKQTLAQLHEKNDYGYTHRTKALKKLKEQL